MSTGGFRVVCDLSAIFRAVMVGYVFMSILVGEVIHNFNQLLNGAY